MIGEAVLKNGYSVLLRQPLFYGFKESIRMFICIKISIGSANVISEENDLFEDKESNSEKTSDKKEETETDKEIARLLKIMEMLRESITQLKQKIARQTGIPMSRQGIERKIGSVILKKLIGK